MEDDTQTLIGDPLVIDLSEASSPQKLHQILQRGLQFPDFYGMNWDAFWDAITGLVDMPYDLTFTGWSNFAAALPAEAEKMRALLDEYLAQYGSQSTRQCVIRYI